MGISSVSTKAGHCHHGVVGQLRGQRQVGNEQLIVDSYGIQLTRQWAHCNQITWCRIELNPARTKQSYCLPLEHVLTIYFHNSELYLAQACPYGKLGVGQVPALGEYTYYRHIVGAHCLVCLPPAVLPVGALSCCSWNRVASVIILDCN
jgi:hypothetical protein